MSTIYQSNHLRKLEYERLTMDPKDPDYPSEEYTEQLPYWDMVRHILDGEDGMRRGEEKFLPRMKDETAKDYEYRLENSKFTNIFGDIVQNLSQKPFSDEVTITEGAPPKIHEFGEDVDGNGSSIHSFLGEVFNEGIADGICWVLVDYTKGVPEGATVAQEKALGVRPFFILYDALDVIDIRTAMINGRVEVVHARMVEWVKKPAEGFSLKSVKQVRVLEREDLGEGAFGPPTYTLWEKTGGGNSKENWVIVDGPSPITLGTIPMVPFISGRIDKRMVVKPPLKAAAELQKQHYQQESALKHISSLTAFPMLAANGVSPVIGDDGVPLPVPVGPHQVLYAPANPNGQTGAWAFIEPSAESMKFLSGEIDKTSKELRELGRQPLTADSGNLTVVTTAFAAGKGNSALEAWCLNLKDAAKKMLGYAAMWMRLPPEGAEVEIDTEFDLGLGDDDSFTHVMGLRASGEISRESTLIEAKRRSILRKDFDIEEDSEFLLGEVDDTDLEDDEEPEGNQPPPGNTPPDDGEDEET